jgi:hypothetical protein
VGIGTKIKGKNVYANQNKENILAGNKKVPTYFFTNKAFPKINKEYNIDRDL